MRITLRTLAQLISEKIRKHGIEHKRVVITRIKQNREDIDDGVPSMIMRVEKDDIVGFNMHCHYSLGELQYYLNTGYDLTFAKTLHEYQIDLIKPNEKRPEATM